VHLNHYGDIMTTKTRHRFNSEFKVECAQVAVSRYITGYYTLLWPHAFNGGLTPATAEAMVEDSLLTRDQI